MATFGVLVLLGACDGMRSDVDITPNGAVAVPASAAKKPAEVIVTEGDITSVAYQDLGEINVILRKNFMFDRDPTERMLEQKLQEAAAALGADAVVRVRYGEVNVSLTSWGTLAAEGRAVRFVN